MINKVIVALTMAIDINDATFTWDWTPAPGGATATEFRLKCHKGLGVLPTIVIRDMTLREYPVRGVITGPGFYRCVITAANVDGESEPSAPVFFRRKGHDIILEAP